MGLRRGHVRGEGGDQGGRTLSVGLSAVLAAAILTAVSSPAFAQSGRPGQPQGSEPSRPSATRSVDGWVVSMERGDIESVYVCGEWAAADRWSFAGCGKGAGFLYPARPGESDLAHFRVDHDMPLVLPGVATAEFGPGFGWAELQHGRDEPGLEFAPGEGTEVREASGPELAVELEIDSAAGVGPVDSVRARVNAGVAWVPDAPAVVPTDSAFVPFSTLSVNGTF